MGAPDDPTLERLFGAESIALAIERTQAYASVRARLVGRSTSLPRIGRYTLLEKIGGGAGGTVFRAHDPELDRQVAIKLISCGASLSGDLLSRWLREARALAALNHPNIVPVYDVGRYDRATTANDFIGDDLHGGIFVVMEFVAGGTLRSWMRASPRSWQEILAAFFEIGRGLTAAHALGLVHRDVKPSNVLIGTDGRARVADFGIAHAATSRRTDACATLSLDDSSDPGRLAVVQAPQQQSDDSQTVRLAAIAGRDLVQGTPPYMAPEQHRCEETGPAADQFAFCVALWGAAYGTQPFAGTSLEALHRAKLARRFEPVERPAGVPRTLRSILLRGLQPAPSHRFASMTALLEALAGLQRRNIARYLAAGVVAGALGVGVSAWVATSPEEPCDVARERLASAWNSSRGDTIEAAFLATGVDYASSAAASTRSIVDGRVQAWTVALEKACASSTSSPSKIIARCIEQRADRLQALVEELERADGGVVAHAVAAAAAHEVGDRCVDGRAQSSDDGFFDPEVAASHDAIRRRLDRVDALLDTGRYADALEVASSARDEASKIDVEPLRAEAELGLGRAQERLDEHTSAEASLTSAYWRADAIAHGEVAFRAASALVFLVGNDRGRRVQAEQWSRHAHAWADRIGGTIEHAEVDDALCSAELTAGRFDEARVLCTRALDALELELDASDLRVATTSHNLGRIETVSGDPQSALHWHQRAWSARRDRLGDAHPLVAQSLIGIADVQQRRGELDLAIELGERGLAIFEREYGPDHLQVTATLDKLIAAHWMRGDQAQAETMAVRALAIREAHLGRTHADVAISLAQLGVMTRSREPVAARRYFERALEIRLDLHPEHAEVARLQALVAETDLALGDAATALPVLETAIVRLSGALGAASPVLFAPTFARGRALCELGRRREATMAFDDALRLTPLTDDDRDAVRRARAACDSH